MTLNIIMIKLNKHGGTKVKSNVEILKRIGKLSDVRNRLGAKDGKDDSKDHYIENMSARDMVGAWSGWNLGDERWAEIMIDMYNSINESMDETMTDFVWNSVRHRVLESVWNTFWTPQIRLSFIQKLAEYKF